MNTPENYNHRDLIQHLFRALNWAFTSSIKGEGELFILREKLYDLSQETLTVANLDVSEDSKYCLHEVLDSINDALETLGEKRCHGV